MLASVFKMTFMIAYISRTVIIAYVTVGALLIVANQTKNILGFSFPEGTFITTLVDMVAATIKCLKNTDPWSVAMAGATLLIFAPLKHWAKRLPGRRHNAALMRRNLLCLDGARRRKNRQAHGGHRQEWNLHSRIST